MELEQENNAEQTVDTVEQAVEQPVEQTQENEPQEQEFDASSFVNNEFEPSEQTEEAVVEETVQEEPVAETQEVQEDEAQPELDEATESSSDDDTEEFTEWVLQDTPEVSEDVETSVEPPQLELEEEPQVEETQIEQTPEWQLIAQELGVEATSREELIQGIVQTVTEAQEQASFGEDKTIKTLKQFVDMDDEGLMKAELKRQGFTDEEVQDEIDVLNDNRLLKREARKVRKSLRDAMTNHAKGLQQQAQQEEAQRAQSIADNRKELWGLLSKTDTMFGGKINNSQKEAHYKYIASGNFFDEINQSHDNVVKAAWLWKYRDQIIKNMESSGYEKGKKKVLDSLTNPEVSKSTPVPEPSTGDFNPKSFLYDESGRL